MRGNPAHRASRHRDRRAATARSGGVHRELPVAAFSPTEGPTGILNAMKQAGFNVAPYMYGQTPSGNEISLNGSKYKVISGENGPNPGWYTAGMNDSAPGQRVSSPIASTYLSAMTPQMQPQTQDFKLHSINAFL
jgi:hypothetical protein